MKTFDFESLKSSEIYSLLIGAIVPRPIAWISSLGRDGSGNLAPYSFFNAVSSNPPCLAVSITRKRDQSRKDTLVNIEETGEFVVNFASEDNVHAVNESSAEHPYGIDEAKLAGLTFLPSLKIKPPRIAESPIHLECRLLQTVAIGDDALGTATLVIGRIVQLHVLESAWVDGKLQIEQLKPLSRLGGTEYGSTLVSCTLPRPKIT